MLMALYVQPLLCSTEGFLKPPQPVHYQVRGLTSQEMFSAKGGQEMEDG